MNNNFIFPNDPLLGSNKSTEDTLNQLDMYRRKLLEQQQPQQPQTVTIWEEIDRELSSLTEDQRQLLYEQDEFKESQHDVEVMTQAVLASIIRPYMLQNPEAKAAIEKQLDTLKTLKKRVVRESSKQLEQFKEYTEKYSNISWKEYVDLKNNNFTKPNVYVNETTTVQNS